MRARSWLLSFLCCAALVALSLLFADRSFALEMQRRFFESAAYWTALAIFPLFDVGGVALFVVAVGLVAVRGKRLTRWMLQLVSVAAAGTVALVIAELLKAGLGRTPVYPTFLVEGVSAWRPLHLGNFPSATTACVTAVVTVAWMSWPKGRLVWGVIGLLAPLMILVTNSHWLSDVIAGAFLGWALGAIATGMMRNRLGSMS